MSEFDQYTFLVFLGLIVFLIFICCQAGGKRGRRRKRRRSYRGTDAWVSPDLFQNAKSKIKPYCSHKEFMDFFNFICSYRGGYIKRRNGAIVRQEYLNKERGDLKYIFFNIVAPNPNLSVEDKEQFREYISRLGVLGVDNRQEYEVRDSQLKNKEVDEDDYRCKEIGNIGEQLVRDTLGELKKYNYKVINGPILRYGNVAKEYDHIVIGSTGVFCIETKAFGMSYGNPSKAILYIDSKDTWILSRKKKNYKSEKELVSPTNQILEEKKQLENIIGKRSRIPVHPVLVLSNSELLIRNNAKLPYAVVRIDELCDFIINYNDYCQDVDMFYILKSIDKSRVN